MAAQELLDDTLNIGLSETDVTPTDGLSIGLPQNKPEVLLRPKIGIIGVGGGGGNAINNMISSQLQGVSFLVANTDALAMENSLTRDRIQLGANLTKGLGAGSYPEIGAQAAEESADKIAEAIKGFNLLFIAAGMGGGTGTGASPVIARIAKEQNPEMLTIAVVTKPFHFENTARMKIAEQGIAELIKYVDAVIVIPNQNIFRTMKGGTFFSDMFKIVDHILYESVKSITDLLMNSSPVNRDFADLRKVLSETGLALIGVGEASGENRALVATEQAINNPLLDVSIKGAKTVLINVASATNDFTIAEADEIGERINQEVDPNALILFGVSINDELKDALRISVIASGLDEAAARNISPVIRPKPQPAPVQEQPTVPVFEPERMPLEEPLEEENKPTETIPSSFQLIPELDLDTTASNTPPLPTLDMPGETMEMPVPTPEEISADLAASLASTLNTDLPPSEDDTFIPPPPMETSDDSILDNILDGDGTLLEEAHEDEKKAETSMGNNFFKNLFSSSRKHAQKPMPMPEETEELFPNNLDVPSFLRQSKK